MREERGGGGCGGREEVVGVSLSSVTRSRREEEMGRACNRR